MQPVLVLGIGNTLLGDDGAGVRALERLRAWSGPGSLALVDGGTLGFTLLPSLETHRRLIVLDSAELGASPGTVRVFEGAAMDDLLSRPCRTVHEAGIGDLLQMLRLSGCLPERRALVGIQPEMVGWSENLCPAVASALDEVATQVRALVVRWHALSAQVAA